MSALLLAVPGVLLVAAAACALLGGRRAGAAGRLGVLAGWSTFALALVLGAAVLLDGPVQAVLERSDASALAGLSLDRVGAVLLLLVTGVGAVVQSFARRYLYGDPRASWLFACTNLLTAASAGLVSAATLLGLAACWTTAGLALVLLLATYWPLDAARLGVRRTAQAFVLGDLALWVAVGIALVRWDDLDLRTLAQRAPDLTSDRGTLAVVASLVVVAALARSAQLPFASWLPTTLAAPTPVSAMLHAGVVNAGGVLLVTLSPLFAASTLATHLAFAAGALTTVWGTLLMLAKPDIKGALAHSTMGQMGFMVMTCGLGAFAAATFHLVAHGMYKSTLFLGSGSAVRRHVRHLTAPPAPRVAVPVPLTAVALVLPALALLGAGLLLHPAVGGGGGSGALLVFAWASLSLASIGWLRRHPTPGGAISAGVVVLLAAFTYLALLRGVTDLLAPALAGAGSETVSVWWLLPVVALLAGITVVRFAPSGSRLAGVHDALYVLALGSGHVRPRRLPRDRSRPVPAPVVSQEVVA